jgi:outer membrane protein
MRKTLLAGLIFSIFSGAAQAENLSRIYEAARAYDAQFNAAQATFRATQEKLPQARAALLPDLSAAANVTYNDFENTLPANGDYTSYGWSVSAKQPIYRKRNFVAYEQAKQQVTQATLVLSSAEQDLILRTARAYFDVLLAQDALRFIQSQKVAITEQLASAKRNFEVGNATITDAREAQARYDLAVSQEIAAQNDLEVKRRALDTLTGTPAQKLAALNDRATLPPPPADMKNWSEQAATSNLSVKIQQFNKSIADLEINRAKANYYPTLDAVASYNDTRNQNFGPTQIDSKAASLGVQLAIPIYQGGISSSLVREAMANQERAQRDLDNANRNAILQTQRAYLNMTSAIAQVRALEQALLSSQASLDATRLGLEVGVRTNVDVLNAQQQLFSAKRDLASGRYNYILSVLDLKAAAGSLSAADLQEIDRLLEK